MSRFLTGALLLAIASISLFGQSQEVVISQGSPNTAYQFIGGYTGTDLIYTCKSRSTLMSGNRPTIRVAISAATAASPIVFTSASHGFYVDSNNRPSVTISGGTGNWTAVNGTFTAIIVNSNTFSIAVNGTGFGALTGTLKFTTTAPRTTVAEWAVQLFGYDGSHNLIYTSWLNGNSAYSSKCSEATTVTVGAQ